ncbi:MAG: helix-turn-helix transcriptional regulator, partial [Anaerotignum sp.]|nr:helix-turn-helix transcriptional regulator [Anaerotignum sp.]
RLSKKNLHTSPMQYLLSYRLEESEKKLLKNPEMTISEIAYSCGFNDASYFNRCFLKKSRMTPSRYRLENQNRDFD